MTVSDTSEDLLTIGAVLSLLQGEFPDAQLSISKIRFLESEGLVNPYRTPTRYRKYKIEHVERLRYILRTQRDQFLPLRVIRDHLEMIDRGMEPDAAGEIRPRPPAATSGDAIPAPQIGANKRSVELTLEDLGAETGFSVKELVELDKTKVISRTRQSETYGLASLEILRAMAALTEFGFEPRHLRPLVLAADKQVDLIASSLSTRRASKSGGSDDEIRHEAQVIATLTLRLQSVLIEDRLSRALSD